MHAEPVLDHYQVAVVIAEQRPDQVGLFELQLEPGATGIVGNGGIAAGHQAATPSTSLGTGFVRSAPERLFGPAAVSSTRTMSPIAASV